MDRRVGFAGVAALAWALAALAAISCGGASTAGNGTGDVVVDAPGGEPGGPEVETGPDADRDGGGDPRCRFEIVLLRPDPIQLDDGDSIALPVKVLDYEEGAPAANACVAVELTSQTNLAGVPTTDGDAQLSAATIVTNEAGIAVVDIVAGTVEDRIYTLTATLCDSPESARSCEEGALAEARTIKVRVSAAPAGCLEVSLDYLGPLPPTSLKDVKVSILAGGYTCDVLAPEQALPQGAVLAQNTVTDILGTLRFELPSGNYYTVFVTAKGATGCVAVYGCDDGVFLQPGLDKCYQEDLALDLVRLNVTGCYDADDHFDFTNLIKECAGGITDPLECVQVQGADVGKQVCCVVHQLVTFFDAPGTTIVNLIVDAASLYFGQWLTGFLDLFKDAVAKIVTDWLLNDSPAWLQDFFQSGQKVMEVVTNVHLHSTLCLSKLETSPDGMTVKGKHEWTGITLCWIDGNCVTFDMQQIQNTQFPLNLVAGSFVADVEDLDKLLLREHQVKLNYGKLVLFVLNEMVIAGLTQGQCPWTADQACHSLEDVAKLWLDCKAIAQGVLGEIAGWFGGTEADVEKACGTAVDQVAGLLTGMLGALTLDTHLALSGHARLVDKDCDLVVDEIMDGHYDGHVETGSGAGAEFTGTWEAVKKGATP